MLTTLVEKIERKEAKLAVIGMGYVGLPLALEFAKGGIRTIGIDICSEKVAKINGGESYVSDVKEEELKKFIAEKKFSATDDFCVLQDADCICICVPTPLSKTKDPDISHIVSVCDEIAKYAHSGLLVVLESTTYPGSTEELILPRLMVDGAKPGEDFFLAFSPERVDPGNQIWTTRNTPKVIGGMTSQCTTTAVALYKHAVDTVVPVSTPAAAEMVKLLENTFRSVNIGLVNEIAMICNRLDLNVWEIAEAASSKPFGFMQFSPGPGLGGHCLPIDPLYLSWKMRGMDYETRFIDLADKVNSHMPHYVVGKISDALNDEGKAVKGSRTLILGVAYKADVDDVRESPAIHIIELLRRKGAEVNYHDPHVPRMQVEFGGDLTSVDLDSRTLELADCVVIVTAHSTYDWHWVAKQAGLIVDTRNALKHFDDLAKVHRL